VTGHGQDQGSLVGLLEVEDLTEVDDLLVLDLVELDLVELDLEVECPEVVGATVVVTVTITVVVAVVTETLGVSIFVRVGSPRV
jgi:hypothetical protein